MSQFIRLLVKIRILYFEIQIKFRLLKTIKFYVFIIMHIDVLHSDKRTGMCNKEKIA